jgi:DNA-binding CsgD family transcriptional regulator
VSVFKLFATGHTLNQIAEARGCTPKEIARAIGVDADNEYARYIR